MNEDITKNDNTNPVIVENIFQKPDYSGKNSPDPQENPVIVENSQPAERIIESSNIEPEFVPDPEENPKVYYEDPNFDWDNNTNWVSDKYARRYYENNIKPTKYPNDFSSKTY